MMTLAVYNAQKEKVGELAVSDTVFGVTPKEGVLHEVVKWQLAGKRAGTACVKTRGEVFGSKTLASERDWPGPGRQQ